jgi:hypothetical protein
MRRAVVLAVFAFLSLLPAQAEAQGGYCSGFDMRVMDYADIAGDWIGHQRRLTILPAGCGVVYWRNLSAAPSDPWQDVSAHVRIEGRAADGTIIGTFAESPTHTRFPTVF